MPMLPNTDGLPENQEDEDDVSDEEPESHFDDSEEGSFEYEFEDRVEIGGGGITPHIGLYIFLVIIALVGVGGFFCIRGAIDDNAGKGPSIDRTAEREWCIEHAPTKQELARCLKDPNYRPNHE